MEQVNKITNPYILPGVLVNRTPIPTETIRAILREQNTKWVFDVILLTVSDVTKIPIGQILSKRRDGPIVTARHLVRFYACEVLSNTIRLHEVAAWASNFRSKDHSTVIKSRDIIHDALKSTDLWSCSVQDKVLKIDQKLIKTLST